MGSKKRPCKKCGSMERTKSGHCDPCSRLRVRALTPALALKPCPSCGSCDRTKRGECRPCHNARCSTARLRLGERNSQCSVCGESDRDRYGACRPCSKVRGREWARANKDQVNPRLRLKKYGLTQAEFDRLLETQKGLCGACGDPLPERSVIDHDHQTGQVRGILCNPCNLGIGLFKDDPDVLDRASAYLRAKAPKLEVA